MCVEQPPQTCRADSALALPSRELTACVRAYYWHDLRHCGYLTLEQRLTYIPPSPYNALVWLLDGRALLVECDGTSVDTELPAVFLAGAHRHAYRSMAITPYSSFGLVFQPGALALLSGMDMACHVDRITDAFPVLPSDWQPLLSAVTGAHDHAQRIVLCERFLAPRWAAVTSKHRGWVELIGDAWQHRARVVALGMLNWTQRHFQRRTRQLTGLKPREVERMLRLERALLDVRDGRASRVEAAVRHGYADQPHFTREVRTFYQRSSGELLRRLNEPHADGDWPLRL